MLYWQLFTSFFQIGLFSFGGGMAAVPLIQQQVVTGHGWLTMSEFTDLITISEMTPGPIAVNSSTFVGMRIAGIPGALVATFSCIAPACLIVSLLAWLYFKYQNLAYIQGTLTGLRPAVVALIASAGVSILSLAVFGDGVASAAAFNWLGAGLFVAAFVVYVHSAISDLASRARRYPLCILAIMLKTYLGKQCTCGHTLCFLQISALLPFAKTCWATSQTLQRFFQNRLRSCGAGYHSILESEARIFRIPS